MKIISHRGNLNGPSDSENSIVNIHRALSAGFDVEIDLWFDNGLWLGHDQPSYFLFDHELLKNPAIWIHAKNLEGLDYLCKNFSASKFFWHQEDDFTLTSDHRIWTYPGRRVTDNSIIVALDYGELDIALLSNAFGVCTDDPMYALQKMKSSNIEKRYSDYVEMCLVDNGAPMTIMEFSNELRNGKCELCLLFDSPACECVKELQS